MRVGPQWHADGSFERRVSAAAAALLSLCSWMRSQMAVVIARCRYARRCIGIDSTLDSRAIAARSGSLPPWKPSSARRSSTPK